VNAIEKIEKYILDYVSFEDNRLAFLLALWSVAAGTFETFDAFPYIVITSNTKRSGKTRTSELLGFLCKHVENLSGLTVATLFRMIDSANKPTLIADESEFLSGESASPIRAVLNVGYRKGQTVPRVEKGSGDVKHYPTYCPKIFVLIGDVYDTLRDRSIVITMRRGEAARRFRYDEAQEEGKNLRVEAEEIRAAKIPEIEKEYRGLDPKFLSDRDAEIWSPILAVCYTLCPERKMEIEMLATDLCALKTEERKRHTTLNMFENEAQNDEYAKRLLLDMQSAFLITKDDSYGNCFIDCATGEVVPGKLYHKKLSSEEVVKRLHAMPLAPWRKFRGEGLKVGNIPDMLSRFGVKTFQIRFGIKNLRGYKLDNVLEGIASLGKT
jgi:uncharacterized protein DUF3631